MVMWAEGFEIHSIYCWFIIQERLYLQSNLSENVPRGPKDCSVGNMLSALAWGPIPAPRKHWLERQPREWEMETDRLLELAGSLDCEWVSHGLSATEEGDPMLAFELPMHVCTTYAHNYTPTRMHTQAEACESLEFKASQVYIMSSRRAMAMERVPS